MHLHIAALTHELAALRKSVASSASSLASAESSLEALTKLLPHAAASLNRTGTSGPCRTAGTNVQHDSPWTASNGTRTSVATGARVQQGSPWAAPPPTSAGADASVRQTPLWKVSASTPSAVVITDTTPVPPQLMVKSVEQLSQAIWKLTADRNRNSDGAFNPFRAERNIAMARLNSSSKFSALSNDDKHATWTHIVRNACSSLATSTLMSKDPVRLGAMASAFKIALVTDTLPYCSPPPQVPKQLLPQTKQKGSTHQKQVKQQQQQQHGRQPEQQLPSQPQKPPKLATGDCGPPPSLPSAPRAVTSTASSSADWTASCSPPSACSPDPSTAARAATGGGSGTPPRTMPGAATRPAPSPTISSATSAANHVSLQQQQPQQKRQELLVPPRTKGEADAVGASKRSTLGRGLTVAERMKMATLFNLTGEDTEPTYTSQLAQLEARVDQSQEWAYMVFTRGEGLNLIAVTSLVDATCTGSWTAPHSFCSNLSQLVAPYQQSGSSPPPTPSAATLALTLDANFAWCLPSLTSRLIIPLHMPGHFGLLAFDPATGILTVGDSLAPSYNPKLLLAAAITTAWLAGRGITVKKTEVANTLRQYGCTDCGLFTILFATHFNKCGQFPAVGEYPSGQAFQDYLRLIATTVASSLPPNFRYDARDPPELRLPTIALASRPPITKIRREMEVACSNPAVIELDAVSSKPSVIDMGKLVDTDPGATNAAYTPPPISREMEIASSNPSVIELEAVSSKSSVIDMEMSVGSDGGATSDTSDGVEEDRVVTKSPRRSARVKEIISRPKVVIGKKSTSAGIGPGASRKKVTSFGAGMIKAKSPRVTPGKKTASPSIMTPKAAASHEQ